MDDREPDRRTDDRPSFVAELKRRKVTRVAIAYAAVAFVVLQAADLAVNAQILSEDAFRLLALATVVMLPVTLVLGWVFDLTPEGVRIAGRAGGRVVATAIKPWVVYGTGAALLGALALFVVLRPTRARSAEVVPGADVIAVLPFRTNGEDVAALGEGMADLLSRNLDQVGAIRTVDPRTVLYRWEQRTRNGELQLADPLALGRELNAGSVLTGSVVEAGPQVRISASLVAIDSTELATARVTGAVDSVLTLVDSLSVFLLRSIWRSSAPHPRLDVAAITSSDLGAIRAFLEGERHYRASRWNDAMSAFAQAVAKDALFPLAHYRIATTAGWASSPGGTDIGRRSAEFALLYADSLPARERTLVIAQGLRANGDLAASIDTLREHLRRYPDDAEAWFALAEDRYHLHTLPAGPTRASWDAQLADFDRALDRDPTFLPALIHPLEIAFLSTEPERIARYIELLERHPSADPAGVALYHAAATALRPPLDGEGIGSALALVAATADTADTDLVYQATRAVVDPLLRAAATLPAAERRIILDRLRARATSIGARATGDANPQRMLVRLMLAGGRMSEAADAIASDPAFGGPRASAAALRWLPALAGHLGAARPFPDAVADATRSDDHDPDASPRDDAEPLAAELVAAIDTGDRAALGAARRALEDLGASPSAGPDSADAALAGRIAPVAAGFARLLDGDTVAALAEIEGALKEAALVAGAVTDALWFRWLERLAMRRETRDRAIALARRPWPGDPVYEPLRWLVLGRALAADGENDAARVAYTRAASALAGAGAGTRARVLADEAGRGAGR